MIVLIIALGYILTKKGMFSAKTRADLTNIIIYVILPCNIFASFEKGISVQTLWQCALVFGISFGLQLFYFLLNRVLYIGVPLNKKVILQYATICNNAGFMGLPVIDAVLGPTALLYGAIILIPTRIIMWTAGLSLFTSTAARDKIKTVITHPCIWAVILGFPYSFAPFDLPDFAVSAINTIGGCTTALSMLVVGSILSDVDIKSVFDKLCFYYSFIRLIFIPAVVFVVLYFLGVSELAIGASVLSSAMPAATVTAMLAQKYGQDAAFASKTLLVSTLLSVLTLPIVTTVMTHFLKF